MRAFADWLPGRVIGSRPSGRQPARPLGSTWIHGWRSRHMAEPTAKLVTELIAPLRVPPGTKVSLERDFDPAYTADFLQREEGEELLHHGVELLTEYQARLAAQDTYGLLVVIQGIDAGGKDGTIKHVMSGVNPQGVSVHSFKAPSAEELDHDYLWRCAQRLPARGEIGIFNRSHYEEVLVVRVHPDYLGPQRLPEASTRSHVWTRRYREITDWERYLFDNGFRIVKLFLNISKEEQRRRFLDRIDEPEKNWKFSVSDAQERQHWDAYQEAFSAMLSATSTEWAPWYVIPSDHKWFARIAAAGVIAKALIDIDPRYPTVDDATRQALLEARAALVAEAAEGTAPEAPRDAAAATPQNVGTDAGGSGKREGKKGKKRRGKKRK
jgi:PPK2 family polyphosphate:nucleotide phosphotransferase